VLGEVEGYQKFFYCPKVSRKERHTGFDTSTIPTNPEGMYDVDGTGVQYNAQKNKTNGNNHPTVKPVALMRYLIKLVTPPNSTVLDPFTGSGSTGMAATELGHTFIGCELDPNYVAIAKTRIEAWNSQEQNPQFDSLFYEE
jgi:site-specific DNA-methyltransferase (adenine-specific)